MRLPVSVMAVVGVFGLAGMVPTEAPAQMQAPAPAPAMPAAMVQGFTNAAIAEHARRIGGQAPRERRKTCEGDVNGDGHGDVVVAYVVEGAPAAGAAAQGAGGAAKAAGDAAKPAAGGGGWTQYLIVMTSTPQGFGATAPKEVGATGTRAVESCTVAGGAIEAATKEFAPNDPACCPSKPGGTLHLTLEKGKLVEAPGAAPAPKSGS